MFAVDFACGAEDVNSPAFGLGDGFGGALDVLIDRAGEGGDCASLNLLGDGLRDSFDPVQFT